MNDLKKNRSILIFVALIYSILVIVGISRHELWMDEGHHWLVARDSSSLVELLSNLRYEGHPVLWNILLYVLHFFTENPCWMQFLHASIMVAAILLFLAYAPFPLWFRALFPFGYFTFFEYALISRNYALAWLFTFAFAAHYRQPNRNDVVLAILLALLANTHLLGLVLAGSLFLLLVVEDIRSNAISSSSRPIATVLSITLVGFGLALVQIFPPGNHPMFGDVQWTRWFTLEEVRRLVLVFSESLFPIPDVRRPHFWHTNYLENLALPLARVLSIFLACLPILIFRRQLLYLIPIYLVAGAVLLLSALKGVNYERFHGFIYLTAILCLWMSKIGWGWNLKIGMFIIALSHMTGGILAWANDMSRPFSESKRAATYLQAQFGGQPLMAEYCFGEALQSYLERPLLYPEFEGETFCRWEVFDEAYLDTKSKTNVFDLMVMNLMRAELTQAIWVHYRPLELENMPLLREVNGKVFRLFVHHLAEFTENVKQMESFYLYELRVEQVGD